MSESVPRAVRNWFKAAYPTLVFEETWLAQCCQYLQTHFELTVPQLIKKVENQLLLSDLSDSTIVADCSVLKDVRVGDGGVEAQPKEVELGSRGILVQIQSMTEVGHSALSLQTVHQKLQDDAQGRDRVVELEDPESQDRHAPISYPRAMLKFQLSDGHHSVPAIEYHRIDGLSLAHTPLGSKLLLKCTTARRGLLLLTPENTTIKGFQVDELDTNRDQVFREGLQARLLGRSTAAVVVQDPERVRPQPTTQHGNPPIPNHSTSTSLHSASIVNSHDPSSANQPTVIDLCDSDDYFDDNSDFEAQLLAHHI